MKLQKPASLKTKKGRCTMNNNVKPNLIKPRWSKVLTDLWEDKTRTGLVVASIVVGVFAIGMIITAYVILSTDINRSYASVNPSNIEIQTDLFDEKLVQVIEKIPGVEDAEGRNTMQIRARRGSESWQDLTLFSLKDCSGKINRLDPIKGTQFPAENEIIVNQDMMNATGFEIGDTIEIELPDGSKHELTMVGLVTDQTSSNYQTNLAYITLKTLNSFGIESDFNQLDVTVDGDGSNSENIANISDSIKDKVKEGNREVYSSKKYLSTEHPQRKSILAIIGVLGALGGLITILSSSLIINTLNSLLTQQLRQIGIMKLIGGRSHQIMGMYLILIVTYGLIALVLAVPLGAITGYGLASFIANLIGAVLQGFRIIPAAVITQTLIAILIPLGTGFFPVNRGAKTSVQHAISNYRPGDQALKKKLFNINTNWISWIPRPILLSFRNTFRKRERLLLTIFTLTVAGAVFIAVFNVRDSLNNLMSQLMQHFMSDVTVNFSEPYRVDKIQHSFLMIPGIKGVEGWGFSGGEIWDENDNVIENNLQISAPPQGTKLLTPEFVAGRWLLPNEEKAIVVSDNIYKLYPNLQPGDKLRVKIPGRKAEEWTVVGVFLFADMGGTLAYTNFEYLANQMHMPNMASSFRLIIENHDEASQRALTQRIDQYLQDRDFSVQSVESGYIAQADITQSVNIVAILLLIMAILIAFVGSIGLTGTMSINVLERTREIGVMRTIGATDAVVMQSVMIEGLVVGLITWALAIGLSFPISSVLLGIVGKAMMGSMPVLKFTPLGILIWLGVVIILSIFASIVPARNAARLTINEVLAYE
jgi:putative ABC transport system permease protein